MGATEIKIARLRKGIQQKDFAKSIGIHYTMVSNIECRKMVANEKQREAIIGALGGDEADYFEQSGLAK